MKNCILIVLDSLGIGALPDAADYGDAGAATLQHILQSAAQVDLPHLRQLGLGKVEPLVGVDGRVKARGAFGKMASATIGKDTTAGHWELMGISLQEGLRTFPNGFDDVIMEAFCARTGYGYLANCAASGTEIIKQLGQEHLDTKKLIVYTSSDSVFQIAAHEEMVPVEELYRVCHIAREICDQHNISRVIARPFVGQRGEFTRTKNRKDFSILPPQPTVLDHLQNAGVTTVGIGKIDDIFAGQGVAEKIHAKGNPACVESTLQAMERFSGALIFTNLVDFDMLYGHRRNPQGYYDCIKEFDQQLPAILQAMSNDDLLLLTADHGNDPTFRGTDHTREYVPLLAYSPSGAADVDLGTLASFADVGSTVANFFGTTTPLPGTSFLPSLWPELS